MNVRESLLQAGVALLKERGIAALTQPQVAAAAGVKQSHLTYYFPTRADLLLGIAEASIESTMADLAQRLEKRRGGAKDASPADLAATVAEVMIAGIPPRVIIGLIVAADADPEIHTSLRRFIAQIRVRIQFMLDKAGLPAGPEQALLFHAIVVGLAVMHQARQDANSAREVREGVAAMLRLLAQPGATSEMGESA